MSEWDWDERVTEFHITCNGQTLFRVKDKWTAETCMKEHNAALRHQSAPVKKTPGETWRFITDQCAEGEKADKLSDAELAEALQRKIADHISMNEPAFALIAEAADRLAKSAPVEAWRDLGDGEPKEYGDREIRLFGEMYGVWQRRVTQGEQ